MTQKNNVNQYVSSTDTTVRELRQPSSSTEFYNKYRPSRIQLFKLNEMIDRMSVSSGHSRELIYHSVRDAFCFSHQVTLPETYQGFRNAKIKFDIK